MRSIALALSLLISLTPLAGRSTVHAQATKPSAYTSHALRADTPADVRSCFERMEKFKASRREDLPAEIQSRRLRIQGASSGAIRAGERSETFNEKLKRWIMVFPSIDQKKMAIASEKQKLMAAETELLSCQNRDYVPASPMLPDTELQKGYFYHTHASVEVVRILRKALLVEIRPKIGPLVVVYGIDADGVVDGAYVDFPKGIFELYGTEKVETADGTKTLFKAFAVPDFSKWYQD